MTIAATHDSHQQPDNPKKPFAKLPHDVLSDRQLSDGAKVCYATLDRYWRAKEKCWPFQETLAADMGVSVDTVQRRLRELKRAGLVEVVQRGLGRPNLYRRTVRPRLRVVAGLPDAPEPAPENPGCAPETAPVRLLETASVRPPIQKETQLKETQEIKGTDVSNADRVVTLDVIDLMERMVLPLLEDADANTLTTFARIVLSAETPIHEGHVFLIADKLTGEVPNGRYSTFDHVHRRAAYVCRVLQDWTAGVYWHSLPDEYERLKGTGP